jgi:drug/metabolite transporter (DMT)-like permease
MNDRTKGLGIALFGVFCVSPDALLVRFLSTHGSDPWTIIFWKLLLSIPLSATFAIYEAGGVKKLINIISSGRGFYCAVVPVQSVIDIGYTLSFVYTSAAVALLLINLNPLWGAIIGKIVLKDALPLRTYIAMILALGCMLIIFIPEFISGEERSTTSLTGNVISLFTGFLMALYLSIVRKAGQYDISLVGGTPLGAFSSTIISAIITRGQVLPSLFWDTDMWKFWLSVVAQGISIGIVFVAMVRVSLGSELGNCFQIFAILSSQCTLYMHMLPVSFETSSQ